MKDDATKQQFILLRAQGYSFDRIAKEISVSKPTLMKWEGELMGQISEARFERYIALADEFQLVKQERIKRLAKQLQKVEEELNKRTFANVPDDKLLAMAITLQERITEELNEVSHTQGGLDDASLDPFSGTKLLID